MAIDGVNNFGYNNFYQNYYGYNPLVASIAPPQSCYNIGTVGFRGDGVKQLTLPNDSAQFSSEDKIKGKQEKKKLSTGEKVGIGVGTIGGIALAAIAFASHKHSAISKLYKEKLVLSNLAENIQFKEAKTAEEGIKFAKEVLGIKEVDKAFSESVDAINVANRGLVDIVNAHKGKCFLPPALRYEAIEDDTLAYVVRNIDSNEFGNLVINKNMFNDEYLKKTLDEMFHIRDFAPKQTAKTAEKTAGSTSEQKTVGKLYANFHKETLDLKERYIQSADNLSIMEKRKLYGDYSEASKEWNGLRHRYPAKFLKWNQEFFAKSGITYNLEEISKLKVEEQSKKLDEILRLYEEKNGHCAHFTPSRYNQEQTIWHEMGHLQDYARNLKELDLKEFEIGTKDYWKNLWNDIKTHNKRNDRTSVNELENHWGRIGQKEFKELLEKNPEKFKKLYPEFYEFITDRTIQETAGSISGYAQSGIGEFIAETYAEMIKLKKEGKTLSKEIMDLYRKYNGPEIP